MTLLRTVPLDPWHRGQGARMGAFAGYDMPIQYEGILAEHLAVRNAAGLFDVSHMGEAIVKGKEAVDFLELISTNRIASLRPGKAVYTPICNEMGGTVDDIIIYHWEDGAYFICLNAANTEKDIQWLTEHSRRFDCLVEDVSLQFAQLAIQGPLAWSILSSLCEVTPEKLPRFGCIHTHIRDAKVFLSRTGYTGEDGAELYFAPSEASALIDQIMEAGAVHKLVPCGLGARDSLRLEAGYPLYGHELTDTLGPLEAGLDWTVKFSKKGDFIGRAALEAGAARGWPARIHHFLTGDRRILRPGTPLLQNDSRVGTVLSGAYSPVLQSAIGSALINEDREAGTPVHADIRGQPVFLQLAKPPLHLSHS